MTHNIIAVFFLGMISLSGCAVISKEKTFQPEPTEALVEIVYATDRKQTGKQEAKFYYGNERGEISYGTCVVAINIEKSKSKFSDYTIWTTGYQNKPGERGELRKVDKLEKNEFLKEFGNRINASKDKSALIYIHGYYRTFEIAAKSVATLVYEIKYQGTPIMFSWPSRYELAAYHGDMTSIDWSTAHLRDFLEDIALRTDIQTIHIIAHSLGNRGFVNAFIDLLKNPDITSSWKFGEIVLAAPDLDRQIFERDIAPIITETSSRITLYVSGVDIPLLVSKAVNLYTRLGDISEEPVIIEGIETIDASHVVTLYSGHTYYRESPMVMEDLYYLINQRKGASNRPTLKPVDSPRGRYWEILEDSTGP